MATELLVRPRGVDLTTRSADVRLQLELGVGAERAEVGDEPGCRQRRLDRLVRPRECVRCRDTREDRRPVVGRDRRDRDHDRLRPCRHRRDCRVQRAGCIVVEDDRHRVGVLRVERLVVEAARATADEGDLAGERVRRERRTAVARRRRRAGEDDLATAGERHGRERAPCAVVAVCVATHGERGQRGLRVVEGRDTDHLAPDTRGSGRPELAAVRAAVADRRDNDHARVDEVVRSDRLRRLRPVAEGRADAHVQHVGVIRQRELHCVNHHVGVRRAVAAEHAVGEQLRARRHAHDLARAMAVSGSDARDVRAVAAIGCAEAEHLLAIGEVRVARQRIAVGMRDRLEARTPSVVVVVADEVVAAANLARRPEAAAKLRQRVVEAAVHDRDRHAGAVETELVVCDVRAGHPERVLQLDVRASPALGREVRERDGVDRIDGLDAGNRSQRGDLRRRHGDREAIPK